MRPAQEATGMFIHPSLNAWRATDQRIAAVVPHRLRRTRQRTSFAFDGPGNLPPSSQTGLLHQDDAGMA
jgi:hypothetical protein